MIRYFTFFIALAIFTTVGLTLAQTPDEIEAQLNVPKPGELEKRPSVIVHVSQTGALSVDGVVFSFDQMAVLLRHLFANEPNIVLRLRGNRDTKIRHYKNVVKIASEQGLKDVIFGLEKEKNKENKPELLTPACS